MSIRMLYDCNLAPDESRLIPALVLLGLTVFFWRLRRPADAAATSSWRAALRSHAGLRTVLLGGSATAAAVVGHSRTASFGASPFLLATAFLLVTLLLLWILAHRSRRHSVAVADWDERSILVNLAPAVCAFAVVVLVLSSLFASGFFERLEDVEVRDLHFAVSTALRDSPHTAHNDAIAVDMGGRAVRALAMALTLGAALVAAWVTCGLWWQSRSLAYNEKVFIGVITPVGIAAVLLGLAGKLDLGGGMGSAVSNTMLCATWSRTPSMSWMPMVADAHNVIGIYIPTILGLGICLLLEPVGRWRHDPDELDVIARRSKTLDYMLYLGAASLVFGTFQMSAIHGAAVGPLSSLADLKTKAEFCKSTKPNGATDIEVMKSTPARRAWADIGCDRLLEEAKTANLADAGRRFARAVTLSFGIAFSALLIALYVPAVLLLRRAALATRPAASCASDSQRNELLLKLGIESDVVGRLGRSVAALSPLLAGLLSVGIGSLA